MREVVAEFKKPVMLYSIGKDSSVMLHLATMLSFHHLCRFRCYTSIRNDVSRNDAADAVAKDRSGSDRACEVAVA
jgi:hypothetical protein